MAVLSVNMVTANMLLSVLFLSGVLAACPEDSDLFITAPQKMEALSGSCLQIPCNFRPESEDKFDNRREIIGVWIKNNPYYLNRPENVIFNSSRRDNKYPMNITGNLRQRNCTTLFSNLTTEHTDSYHFRIESSAFRATAVCDHLYITVKDSPPAPRIEISGDLKEAESVVITCSALTPCPHSPPQLSWTLQDPDNKIEENTDGTLTTKIQKKITLSDKHDGFSITCSARYPVDEGGAVKAAENKLTLNVSYAPKDTSASISPSGWVSAGSWVNLTCSSRARPPVSCFTWFKRNKHGAMNVSEGNIYSFNATEGGEYQCVAKNDVGEQTSGFIVLNIKESTENLQWEQFLGGIIGFIVLICLIICVCYLKSTHPATQQTQSQTGDESSRATEENIHYGEIDFSKLRPKPSSSSRLDSGQQQDTVYAQVKASKTESSYTKTVDIQEDLYAQVKKK